MINDYKPSILGHPTIDGNLQIRINGDDDARLLGACGHLLGPPQVSDTAAEQNPMKAFLTWAEKMRQAMLEIHELKEYIVLGTPYDYVYIYIQSCMIIYIYNM